MAHISTMEKLGIPAPGFSLPNLNAVVKEETVSLETFEEYPALLVVFICNHCPYVIAIAERLSFEARELKKIGVSTIAIMSNDVENYPEDSFENMKKFSEKYNFEFSYLYDSTQEVAKKFNAVCTPDFFGYNSNLELQYRGRIRELKELKPVRSGDSELLNAMRMVAQTGKGPEDQIPSMGCNIKWLNN